MAQFQRMIVIPQNEYLQMARLQEVKQPLAQQLFTAEQDYQNVDMISDPYARVMAQTDSLNKMRALKEEMRNYVSLATPKPYRSRAERLLSVLEPHISWNERGEMIDEKTKRPIEQSQMSDLIQHAVRDRRRKITPAGWNQFLDILRDYNVPQMLLNLPTLDELKRKTAPTPSPPTPSHSSISSITPRKSLLPRPRALSAHRASDILPKETKRTKKVPEHFGSYYFLSGYKN